jgi:hypothetical protein
MDASRRKVLKAAAVLLLDQWVSTRSPAFASGSSENAGRKIIVVACGGVRRIDTFSESGLQNIPHLYRELLPQSVFYPSMRNAGVTSHYNTISSVLTGNWQRLDDWGKTPPESPTVFEYVRKQMRVAQNQAWFISSNSPVLAED